METDNFNLIKKRLRHEVARFCERDDRKWKAPVVEMLRELQPVNAKAVFFGGTLRSLLISRLFRQRPGRPRDIDIVISGSSVESVRDLFRERVARETRFGGLQLRHWNWQFDVWPLAKTWAFVEDEVENPDFAALPETTFFNLESIAVDVWPSPGQGRRIYSGDDQFFEGILNRTLEINRETNPFPHLCVVRALVLAASIDFKIGPRLSAYIAKHHESMLDWDFEEVQQKHYGCIRQSGIVLKRWAELIGDQICKSKDEAIRLPVCRQLTLWPDSPEQDTMRIHALVR